jgi:PAS domain S-box-containing protein
MVSGADAAPVRVTWVAVGLLPLWLAQGQAEPPALGDATPPPLSTVQHVRALSAEVAQGAQPACLEGVVTFCDVEHGQLFVQDATAGIRCTLGPGLRAPTAGQRVKIVGVSSEGDFGPTILAEELVLLGPGDFPPPKSPGWRRLRSGRFDGQWVALSGIVRAVSLADQRVRLAVAAGEARVEVHLPWAGEPAPPVQLVDAKVRVQGVCANFVDPQLKSLGFELLTPSLSQLEVLEPSPPDPFSLPSLPIRTLLRHAASDNESHRVKVSGVVTLQRGARNLFLQDATGGLYAVCAAGSVPALKPGDAVEVVGFPEQGGCAPFLEDAIVRRTDTAHAPTPLPVRLTVPEALQATNDAELVQLEARFLKAERQADDLVLVLQDSQWLFQAFVPSAAAPRRWQLAPGSLVRLTGVCSVIVDEQRRPRTFRLLLRSVEDVTLLERPPWWTESRAMIASGALALGVCGALGCVCTLRRRLAKQTALIRQRLENEAALERRYRELFEKASDIVYAHDLEGNFTMFNLAAQGLLGYSAEESLRLNVADLVAPEHLERAFAMTARKLGGEAATTYELDLLCKDGRRVSVEVNSRPILRDGRVVGVQGIARDITERKRAARKLEESLSLLHATLEATAEGIVVWDRAGRIINYNQKFLRLWGVPEDWIKAGRHERVLQFMLDQVADADQFRRGLGELAAGPSAECLDIVQFKDGRVFERHALPQRVEGEVVGRVLSFLDVTEQRRAENALRQSEELFSKAFHASPVGLGICTLTEGRYLKVNDAFLSMLGYTRAEVTGRTATELGLWADASQRATLLQTLRTHGHVHNQECQFRTKSGALRTVLASLEQIELDGQPCLLFLNHDITERLQLEEQFRQAQKMESVGRLAAGVAHDFNNMLTVISGHAALLLAERDLKPHIAESLNQIVGAAERAGNLTRQLLAFSRRQPMQLRPLNVNHVLANLSKMLGRLLGENIHLRCHYSPAAPIVQADAGLLEQAIMNLVVNARDAMPQGGDLLLRTQIVAFDERRRDRHPQARAGEFVCLSVADTGCGMDAETLRKIFEPFFTTKETGKGTGLGLATVYGIVQQHQGWIEVTSQVGKGTTFDLYFPRAKTSDTELLRQRTLPVANGCETILLVEDEAAVSSLVKSVLCRAGYHVLEAGNGEDALRAWAQHKDEIDLLLTDLIMPGQISGQSLAERLQAERRDLKVILSTGYSTELTNPARLERPGRRFLWKPYTPQELTQAVRRCLDEALPNSAPQNG